MNEDAFEALLGQALAPPRRPADRAFVARVDRALAEEARYRRRRALMRRQLSGEALVVAALAASLAIIAQAPGVRLALAEASVPLWPALLALLLLGLLAVQARPRILA